jgi:hypothetical protein
MRTVKHILLACTAMAAVAASARDADVSPTYPTKAQPATPAACTSFEDFRDTDCSLTWYGITLYGAYDVGVGWVSHGTPENRHKRRNAW